MTFTSFSFVVFFPIVVVLYYLCPARFRWALLLLASCYFYVVFVPAYLLVLFALIGIDYTMALLIERHRGTYRKHFLIISIVSTLSMLFVFKYFNFFNGNMAALAHALGWNYSIGALYLLLPLGLSFHTFQSLSYVIEVYRGKFPAERHLGIYALYVMFFPQLVAGPIERPQHLLPQLKNRVYLNWANMLSGLRLMGWGFFKKLVIADRLAMSVDYIWKNMAHLPGPSIAVAMVGFAFQLYADFSGYSDIARGAARVLGIDVVQNFEQPYFSNSIPEFWRRWHISLSSWFRDYFFTPLALRWRNVYLATLATFIVLGFWHGANWTYLAMGALFGLYIVLSILTKRWRSTVANTLGLTRTPRLHHALQVAFTFALVALTWTFFRAPTISQAFVFIRQLFIGWHLSTNGLVRVYTFPYDTLGFSHSDLLISLGALAALLTVEYMQQYSLLGPWFEQRSIATRMFLYASVVLAIVVYGVASAAPFIYFQF